MLNSVPHAQQCTACSPVVRHLASDACFRLGGTLCDVCRSPCRLGSGVIYIDTERKFSAVRLAEMARAGAAAAAATHAHLQQQQQHPGHNGDGGAGTEAVEAAAMEAMGDAQLAEVLGRVVILNPGSTAELAGVLEVSGLVPGCS